MLPICKLSTSVLIISTFNVDILKKLSNLATHANHYAVHRHMLTCSPLITAKNSQYLSSECLSYSF